MTVSKHPPNLMKNKILTMTTGRTELKAAGDVMKTPLKVKVEIWLVIGPLHYLSLSVQYYGTRTYRLDLLEIASCDIVTY